jgi:hypothetical protein
MCIRWSDPLFTSRESMKVFRYCDVYPSEARCCSGCVLQNFAIQSCVLMVFILLDFCFRPAYGGWRTSSTPSLLNPGQ